MASPSTAYAPKSASNTVTSWIPLTTEFPYLNACSTAFIANLKVNVKADFAPYAFDPKYSFRVNPTIKCFPDQAALWWSYEAKSLIQQGVTTQYSLGPVVCPEAYTTAARTIVSGYEEVACCPTSYEYRGSYRPGLPSECESPLTSGQTMTYVRPKSDNDYEGVFGYVTERTTFTENFHAYAAHINGRNIIAQTTSSASVTSSSALDVSGVTPSTSAGPGISTSVPENPAGDSKLGPATIAGVAIGAVVGIAAVGVLVFCMMRRRRRKNVTPMITHSELAGESHGEQKRTGYQSQMHELPSSQVHELSGHGK